MRAVLALVMLAQPALSQDRLQSSCIALSEAGLVHRAAFGEALGDDTLRIHYLGHASFALETPGGLLAVTDYTGYIGNPAVLPDVVTMNNAHDTHFTDNPDPRIPHILPGWGGFDGPAVIDLDLGEMLVRNVTTDLRGPFGEGARRDGNSIFIFEAAGLCIGHLGHLHQIPSPAQYAAIGRLDVVMVPVDGGFTMRFADMAGVIDRLDARLILPMHWFSEGALAEFLAGMKADHEIAFANGPEVVVGRGLLPERPTVLVLDPELLR